MGYAEIVGDGFVKRYEEGEVTITTPLVFCDYCETMKSSLGGRYQEVSDIKIMWQCSTCRK